MIFAANSLSASRSLRPPRAQESLERTPREQRERYVMHPEGSSLGTVDPNGAVFNTALMLLVAVIKAL